MSGYKPTQTHHYCGDSERTRTSNLLIRSQVLYPLSYGAKFRLFFRAAKITQLCLKNQTLCHIFGNFTETMALPRLIEST